MFIAMNRFKVVKGAEADFEELWLKRDTHLKETPGFVECERDVVVVPDAGYTRRFPDEHACKLTVRLKDGSALEIEKTNYEGFHTRPMSWQTVEGKFRYLSGPYADASLQQDLVDVVRHLEDARVADLANYSAAATAEVDLD